jgi:hypothetical protein
MKIKNKNEKTTPHFSFLTFIFSLLAFLLFFAACLQPEPPEPETPELEIRNSSNNQVLRVVDIDPDETLTVSLFNDSSSTSKRVNVNTESTSALIQVRKNNLDFEIKGSAGAMGIIRFDAGDRLGELRVFIRNWKAADVHRNALYPNMAEYNDYDTNWTFPTSARKNTAYNLIVRSGFHYEAPDGLSSRETNQVKYPENIHRDSHIETDFRKLHDMPHILQVKDHEYLPQDKFSLKKEVFKFTLHIDHDGDMVGGYDDRQRLEIKTMDGEYDNEHMYSRGSGDTFSHRWMFRLPDDFIVSSEFNHIFQIKAEGGDSGNPIFTLTGRKLRTGREVLQLIYRGPIRPNGDPSQNWYPAEADLAPFKGEWVRAEQTITYDNPGAFTMKLVRVRDLRVLMEYTYSPEHYKERDPFMTYRPGNIYIRPKFGVYRRVFNMTPFGLPNISDPVINYWAEPLNENGMRETAVLYAYFEMDKLKR